MSDELTRLAELCAPVADTGLVVALTGAGISRASGIPTFRGKDGYWTVGSHNYHPQELATRQAFERMPSAVWRWYAHRAQVCRDAAPNDSHRALVRLAEGLGQRFVLITQNVDGLHRRAGSDAARTYEIHGNIDTMRCFQGCTPVLHRVPSGITRATTDAELRRALSCAACGGWMRPHVLWFDEYYDEAHFRFESSLAAARRAELLVVVGSTGSTNLPLLVTREVVGRGAHVIVIDPEANAFSALAQQTSQGLYLAGTAERWLGVVVDALCRSVTDSA